MEDIDLKPILYEANTVDFNNNGLGALTEAMFSQVTEERNGIFELSVVYPMSGKLYDRISEHMLLKVKPNKVDDPHVFRIYSLQIDSIAQTVSIDASTKSNELVNNLVKDLAIENTTPQVALGLMKQSLVLPTDYDFISDITSSNSTHWTNRNPLNCIAGEEGSLVDVFGGEIKRGNRTIWLYANRGVDNPNIIRHGKNLQGFTVEYSTKGMTTAILPYFNEKIADSSETQMVYGDIVYSQYANNYPFLYLVAMDYSSEEEVTDLATLNTKASQYFTEHNGIDKPSMSATVDMQDLSDSSEYKRFKSLEHIQLCDTVTVYSKKHKVNLNAKVTKIIFDTLLEKNVSLELGSIRTSLTDSIKQGYTNTIQDLQQNIYQTIETAANGKNRVFRGIDEPITGMIKNDVWYKPVNDGEIEMYVFDGAFWNKEAYSADSLGGTVNFANINAINLNLDALTTATITGANMWLNLVTGKMQFTNPVNGQTTVLSDGLLRFNYDTASHNFDADIEGMVLSPAESNQGTDRYMKLWIKSEGYSMLDFGLGSDFGYGIRLAKRENWFEILNKDAGSFRLVHGTDPASDRQWNFFDGIYGVFRFGKTRLELNGYDDTDYARLTVRNHNTGAFAFVTAAGFDVSSERELKESIVPTENSLALLSTLMVYDYTKDGNHEIGIITDESPTQILSTDMTKVSLYSYTSLAVKSIQELAELTYQQEVKLQHHETEIKNLKQELADLKTLLTEKGVS
jgi:phage minor structural protein